jgi:predicted enzyme related to lactoylglutathione lyase
MTIDVLFASLPVADLREAIPWYERLFGRAADIVPNENEVMWRMTDSGWIYVMEDAGRAGGTVVAIAVSDLSGLVSDLTDRGISPGPIEAVSDTAHKANVLDPDGNLISWIEVATDG